MSCKWRRTKRNISRNFLPAKQEYDDVQRDGSAGRLTEARWKGSGARKGGFGAAKITSFHTIVYKLFDFLLKSNAEVSMHSIVI